MENSKVYAIVDSLKTKKGAFVKLVYERSVAPSAKFKDTNITKHVEMVCRAGIKYSNMAAVIDRRAEKAPNAYVKTWEWVPGYEQFVKRNLKSGQLYVNFETVPNSHSNITYTIDGKEATKEEVMGITPASIWKASRATDTFDIKFENIIKIGGEEE